MTYEKITDFNYICNLEEEVENEVVDMLNKLCGNEVEKYDSSINMELFNSMLARRVASDFFNNKIPLPAIGFCLVDVTSLRFRHTITISLGVLAGNINHRLVGVLYK